MIGSKFSQLTVVSLAGRTQWKELLWHCLCDCGNVSTVRGKSLRSGRTRSCGCLINPVGKGVTHGGKYTRLYRTWAGMIARCENVRSKDYRRYGGAGISVCAEWRDSFECFRDWARNSGYADDLLIDRRDGRLGYTPDNCRWLNHTDSARNTRSVKLSVDAAAEIRRRVASGSSHAETAIAFGVSRSNVSQICEGKAWV